jgi:adenosylcobinamide kinase/adenosylcobinamide-phosphate guanylyltransferase
MGKITFILGGARSGKSKYAVSLAKKVAKNVAFIATCVCPDDEMKERIKLHQTLRPRHWKLIEEGKDIDAVLVNLQNKYDVVLVDCLGLWISNLLAANLEDKEIEKKIKEFLIAVSKIKATSILVSNGVGSGVVPENPLARRFRDLVGLANQMVAKKADEVIFMQAGMPLIIKKEKGVRRFFV